MHRTDAAGSAGAATRGAASGRSNTSGSIDARLDAALLGIDESRTSNRRRRPLSGKPDDVARREGKPARRQRELARSRGPPKGPAARCRRAARPRHVGHHRELGVHGARRAPTRRREVATERR